MSFYNLPDHCILEVFKNLCAEGLVRVRLVCRNWAAIVSDSIALRRKYSLYVSHRSNKYNLDTFIQTFTNSPYNICTNISFRSLVFYEERDLSEEMSESETVIDSDEIKKNIEIMNRLWSKIGVHIECLGIVLWGDKYCKSTKHNWLALLENTPNLINLEVKSGLFFNPHFSESLNVTREFNLEKLKTVTFDCHDNGLNIYLMRILIKFANGLTSIKFSERTGFGFVFDTLYSLIESQRHSLREVILDKWVEKKDMKKYLTIDNLSLEVLHLDSELDTDSLELLGKHENLRDLKIQYSKSTENLQYSTYLPKLEKLELQMVFDSSNASTLFHNNFNNLKSLNITMNGITKKLVAFKNPSNCRTIEVLEIGDSKSPQIFPVSILTIIDSCPNLKVLKLIKISCDARDVAAICDSLVHLEELELRIHTTNIDRNAFSNISNLRKLKRLSIGDYSHICDDRFFIEHLRLPSLISLSFPSCSFLPPNNDVTNRGISGLIDNCPLLEALHLDKYDSIAVACGEEMLKITCRSYLFQV